MTSGLPHVLVRLALSLLLSGLSLWAGLLAIDAMDRQTILASDDQEFQERMAAGLPRSASAAWYSSIGYRALSLSPPDYGVAENALGRSLQINPRDAEVWLSYAYSLSFEAGHEERVISALVQSYSLSPIGDLPFRHRRLRFADSVWPVLPDSLQALILVEATLETGSWLRQNCPTLSADTQRRPA